MSSVAEGKAVEGDLEQTPIFNESAQAKMPKGRYTKEEKAADPHKAAAKNNGEMILPGADDGLDAFRKDLTKIVEKDQADRDASGRFAPKNGGKKADEAEPEIEREEAAPDEEEEPVAKDAEPEGEAEEAEPEADDEQTVEHDVDAVIEAAKLGMSKDDIYALTPDQLEATVRVLAKQKGEAGSEPAAGKTPAKSVQVPRITQIDEQIKAMEAADYPPEMIATMKSMFEIVSHHDQNMTSLLQQSARDAQIRESDELDKWFNSQSEVYGKGKWSTLRPTDPDRKAREALVREFHLQAETAELRHARYREPIPSRAELMEKAHVFLHGRAIEKAVKSKIKAQLTDRKKGMTYAPQPRKPLASKGVASWGSVKDKIAEDFGLQG